MLEFSLVIPAYNELQRLPPYLHTVRDYLQQRYAEQHEVIVVDDGSRDGLLRYLQELASTWQALRVLHHQTNRGKGAALCTGIRAARGSMILLADADGATPIAEEQRLRQAIEAGADIAVGSRLIAGVRGKRDARRGLPGQVFASLVHWAFALPVHDTQCGFKMFRAEAARCIFAPCRETGYLLDIEALLWARHFNYCVAEAAITCRDIAGSKVRLLRDGLAMLQGIFRLQKVARHLQRPRPVPEFRSLATIR